VDLGNMWILITTSPDRDIRGKEEIADVKK